MRQTEDTILRIKKHLAEMWLLVQGQVEKAADALMEGDNELAREVLNREKMVDSYELLIDRECENFFVLLNPVAVDMRLVVSIMKINNDLERIGDFAEGIASFVVKNGGRWITPELLAQLHVAEMLEEVIGMLGLCKQALSKEDALPAGKVFSRDDVVDQINAEAVEVLAGYMRANPEAITECIHLAAAIRRIERIGDRCANIAENIVFYLDARVLKHQGE